VTLSGSGFGTAPGTVRFNGVTGSITSWSDTSIVAKVPGNASSGPVVVAIDGLVTDGRPFTVLTLGAISGSVRRTDGAAVSGASVAAMQSGVVKKSATTAGNGSYSLTGLLSGFYEVRVTASGFAIELQPGVKVETATTTANVTLVVPGSITGHLTNSSTGAPIQGAGITVSTGHASVASALTDAGGNFVISNLRPGTHTVEGAAQGYHASTLSDVVVSEGTTINTLLSLDPGGAGPITYVYDELGRLTAVVDAAGDTATYTYDAVGNIRSIGRHNSSAVAILEFTPDRGAAGSTVTLRGTGFSSTAGENQVAFNGVAAVVSVASPT
jgi:YD repeat-containing protein